jgi:hypothetical protein
MDRRDLLKSLGASAVLAGLDPELLSALERSGARRSPQQPFFTPEQRATVTALADRILPATDTPGAVEAGVPDFIELIVAEWYTPEDRERFLRGLADVDARSQALGGVRFAQAGEAVRVAILTGMEAEGRALRAAEPSAPTPFFQRLRALVLHGYYTSEVGMREELRWHVIPGRYDGCVDPAAIPAPPGGE